MRAMLLIPLLLTSCAVVSEDGAVMLGGKGAAKGGGKTGGGWAMVWNGEDSFRQFTQTAGIVAAGYFATAATKAAEATNQVAAKEATKRHVATQGTLQNGQNVHGAAYGSALKAEVPGTLPPSPPASPPLQ